MQRRRLGVLFAVLLIELIGLGYFIKGFFPYKRSIPGFAQPATDHFQLWNNLAATTEPRYDRLVVMLVDALRNDFVFGPDSGMEYTQELLRNGEAIGYTAKALAPTVTMPRIKALMTGTVPNFLDAVLNIAESDTSSSLAFHDNLLWQLRNHGNKTINLFGDDTWLRLFPGLFNKTDGTSSFFVADTVEVDKNVTRHVRPELESNDWDVTIFHYLGLDHIGHLSGPNSPLMRPKQREMDQVVQDVNEIITRQDKERMTRDKNAKPTLFVLLGDHAMNEIGNHGGNSQLETSTVFVFMGQGISHDKPVSGGLEKLMDTEVPQINLVPTLSLLFGMPIPKNNLGLPLPELLAGSYNTEERLRLLQVAAHQIYGVVMANDDTLMGIERSELSQSLLPKCHGKDDGEEIDQSQILRCLYLRALRAHSQFVSDRRTDGGMVEEEYYGFMQNANEHLSKTFSGYDLHAMAIGIAAIATATLALILLYQGIHQGQGIVTGGRSRRRLNIKVPVLALLGTYILSLTSSSYIEEEHQFWYFWVQTMFCLRLITSNNRSSALRTLAQMALFRVVRAWNQTGQKWAGETDLRHCLNTSRTRLMWILAIATAVLINLVIYRLHARLYVRSLSRMDSKYHRRTGVEQERDLALSQRALRACVAYGSFCTIIYQLDRGQGWQVLGVSEWMWATLRWCTPNALANVARLVYLCTLFSSIAGIICTWLRARLLAIGVAGGASGHQKLSVYQSTALDLLIGMMPVVMLLARPHNIPLFGIFLLMFILFWPQLQLMLWVGESKTAPAGSNQHWQVYGYLRPSKILVQFCLIQGSFFALGNSNSLGSLDLSNAYTGVSRYNEQLVGVLMFIGNWAGPLWWGVSVLASLAFGESQQLQRKEFGGLSVSQLVDRLIAGHLWQSCTLLSLSVVVTLLRTHLFIWSVFSPRYLYQIAWFVGYYLITATVLGLVWISWLAQVAGT